MKKWVGLSVWEHKCADMLSKPVISLCCLAVTDLIKQRSHVGLLQVPFSGHFHLFIYILKLTQIIEH